MKMMKILTFISLLKVSFSSLPFVDLNKYTGKWFQVYANPFSFYVTENGGSCITADYQLLDSSSISILNSELVKGKPRSIQAIGTVIHLDEPGKLTVKFEGVPFNGTYWIYEVGPIVDNQYQYSIVSDDKQSSLFVLARNIDQYQAMFAPKLEDTLLHLGFKTTKLIPTNQTDCF